MVFRKLAGSCEHQACPAVFSTDEDANVIVQGFAVTRTDILETLKLPEGEVAAVVPWSLLESAVMNQWQDRA